MKNKLIIIVFVNLYALFQVYSQDLLFQDPLNGHKVFNGHPRGWYDPDRDKHRGARLYPDQYEFDLNLIQGKNEILVRSELYEIWGWSIWIRIEQ
jgi:hypothetical protein